MDMTIHLSDETGQRLAGVAQDRGETPEAIVAALVEQTFARDSANDLLELAAWQAKLLRHVPRDALMSELGAVREEIRRDAIAAGTTVEEWPLDE